MDVRASMGSMCCILSWPPPLPPMSMYGIIDLPRPYDWREYKKAMSLPSSSMMRWRLASGSSAFTSFLRSTTAAASSEMFRPVRDCSGAAVRLSCMVASSIMAPPSPTRAGSSCNAELSRGRGGSDAAAGPGPVTGAEARA